MFRAAHRSSSGAPNFICSLWFIYPCGDRSLSRLSGKSISRWVGNPFPAEWEIHFPLSLDNGRSPHGYIKPEAAYTVWSSWWWAVCRSKHVEPSINFEIVNSITSCILLVFLLSHTTMHGSTNIKINRKKFAHHSSKSDQAYASRRIHVHIYNMLQAFTEICCNKEIVSSCNHGFCIRCIAELSLKSETVRASKSSIMVLTSTLSTSNRMNTELWSWWLVDRAS